MLLTNVYFTDNIAYDYRKRTTERLKISFSFQVRRLKTQAPCRVCLFRRATTHTVALRIHLFRRTSLP